MDGHAHLQGKKSEAALSPTFDFLFGKLSVKVSKFVIFSNFVNILDLIPAAAATEVKIQIRCFLQMKQAVAITVLEKLLPLPAVSNFLRGKWDRCGVGGLYVHQAFAQCLLTSSSRTRRGALGEQRAAAEARKVAAARAARARAGPAAAAERVGDGAMHATLRAKGGRRRRASWGEAAGS